MKKINNYLIISLRLYLKIKVNEPDLFRKLCKYWGGKQMIEYNAVGLLYTYKCTGTCEICGLKCGPNRNEKMDLEVAKR